MIFAVLIVLDCCKCICAMYCVNCLFIYFMYVMLCCQETVLQVTCESPTQLHAVNSSLLCFLCCPAPNDVPLRIASCPSVVFPVLACNSKAESCSLWCGSDLLFSCLSFKIFMAALRSRCGHYIFVLWFLLSIYRSFSPRLISAVAEWISTIPLHVVWP